MKKITFTILSLAILLQSTILHAQGENLFNDDIVHEIYLSFEEDDFWETLRSNYDDNYPNVPYIMANAVIDGETVDSIGVRLKGFSSYWVATDKKSIKLDFNEFVAGKKYDGLRKVNVNNGEGDPAVQRDKLCYDIMRQAGVDAPRTSYTKVYLNDTFWGLYLLVEQVDKTFLNDNFGSAEGNLFKNMGNSDLEWQGSNIATYQETFELKTDPQDGAWESFVNLIDVINNSSDANFKAAIEEVFDVDLYLKVLAVDVASQNWDSYLDHGRNFYLYENPETGKFQWIPWDYNLAMGGTFSSGFGGGGGGGTPEDPADCNTIINGSCPYEATDTVFIQVIELDPFCCDSDWDGICQDLYDAIEAGDVGGGGPGGSGGPGGGFGADFLVNMSNSEKVLINRLLEVSEYEEQYYRHWCAILENNFTAERLLPMIESDGDLIREFIYDDPNYMWTTEQFEADLDQGTVLIPGLKKFIEERTMELEEQLVDLFDCNSLISSLEFNDIVINEFCASCDSLSGIMDSAGEYDDWIELYNNTDLSIDLSNAYLTDKNDEPNKWSFPEGTIIGADDYLIVWADKDNGQEGLHANFKLAKEGDFIQLMDYDKVLDSLSFEEQTTNKTYSRIPNGTGDFVIKNPTFNVNNEFVSSINETYAQQDIKIFPNPAHSQLHINLEDTPQVATSISLYNTLGQKVMKQVISDKKNTLQISSIIPGIYILTIENQEQGIFHNQKVNVF